MYLNCLRTLYHVHLEHLRIPTLRHSRLQLPFTNSFLAFVSAVSSLCPFATSPFRRSNNKPHAYLFFEAIRTTQIILKTMKLNRSFALSILSVTGFTAVSANLFSQGQGQGQGQGGDHPSNNGRRVGRLGAKTSTSASSADCATGLDIQLYEDSEILTF